MLVVTMGSGPTLVMAMVGGSILVFSIVGGWANLMRDSRVGGAMLTICGQC